jgi:hypothetical protein
MELRLALGEDRWAKVQRSSLKEQIRNCDVKEVTLDEVHSLAIFFDVSIVDTLKLILQSEAIVYDTTRNVLLGEKNGSSEFDPDPVEYICEAGNSFVYEKPKFEHHKIPKRD